MQIGQNVKVKSNLIPNQIYGGAIFVPEMEEFLGKGATVTEILFPVTGTDENKESYGLSFDRYQQYEFTSEMLEIVGVSQIYN